ncbi:MAG: hypothetical protein ACTSPI_13695 [Candidatus Heimdallarchaeaceae archaeon]
MDLEDYIGIEPINIEIESLNIDIAEIIEAILTDLPKAHLIKASAQRIRVKTILLTKLFKIFRAATVKQGL